jgi:hypothetical protein
VSEREIPEIIDGRETGWSLIAEGLDTDRDMAFRIESRRCEMATLSINEAGRRKLIDWLLDYTDMETET